MVFFFLKKKKKKKRRRGKEEKENRWQNFFGVSHCFSFLSDRCFHQPSKSIIRSKGMWWGVCGRKKIKGNIIGSIRREGVDFFFIAIPRTCDSILLFSSFLFSSLFLSYIYIYI